MTRGVPNQGSMIVQNRERAKRNLDCLQTFMKQHNVNVADVFKKAKFIRAMLILCKDEQFTFKKFIKKLSMNRNKLYHCTNTLDYIDTIERLYNWGNATKVKFRR